MLYFKMDAKTEEILRNNLPFIAALHRNAKNRTITPLQNNREITLSSDNKHVIYIEDATVWDTLLGIDSVRVFGFKGCVIKGMSGEHHYFDMCDIEGGTFNLYLDSLTNCNIRDGIFILKNATYWNAIKDRNDINGGKFMGRSQIHIMANSAKNATFVNCYVDIPKCEKCKFFTCLLRTDQIHDNCAISTDTIIRSLTK